MDTMLLLLSLCASVLLIGWAWYAAKRDLTAVAARAQSPAAEELRQMRETVEELIAVLEQKAAEIEERLAAQFDRLADAERSQRAAESPSRYAVSDVQDGPPGTVREPTDQSPLVRAVELLSQGNDARTVAQMTGLTVAEIETAARMKQLRASRG